ncbi:MAG: hypothetical protein HY711_04355 [Candidatus Melainabacteria bacterium]|nr:hypothetical protein [Candidatus Melainabacteria bacterium]
MKITRVVQARQEQGQIGFLLFLAGILITIGVGALGVDLAHCWKVRQELQHATDAAALAGALDLYSHPDEIESHALATAANNQADGRFVETNAEGTRVVVSILAPNPPDVGTITVTAETTVRHWLMPWVGRWLDKVSTTSVASAPAPVTQLPENVPFPLAVSIDAIGQAEELIPLSARNIGDTVQFHIASQQVKNAAFTSFSDDNPNADYVRQAIDQTLGLVPPTDHLIPSIKIGDSISLNNGVLGEKRLAEGQLLEAITSQPFLVLPVFEGEAPDNQSRSVIGFITVRVTNVTVNEGGDGVLTFTCQLLKTVIKGIGGTFPPGSYGDALARLSPLAVKLVQ